MVLFDGHGSFWTSNIFQKETPSSVLKNERIVHPPNASVGYAEPSMRIHAAHSNVMPLAHPPGNGKEDVDAGSMPLHNCYTIQLFFIYYYLKNDSYPLPDSFLTLNPKFWSIALLYMISFLYFRKYTIILHYYSLFNHTPFQTTNLELHFEIFALYGMSFLMWCFYHF